MALINVPFSLFYLVWLEIDDDFNFYLMFAAFRYALSCKLAKVVTERLINSNAYIQEKSERASVKAPNANPNFTATSELSNFAGVTRL